MCICVDALKHLYFGHRHIIHSKDSVVFLLVSDNSSAYIWTRTPYFPWHCTSMVPILDSDASLFSILDSDASLFPTMDSATSLVPYSGLCGFTNSYFGLWIAKSLQVDRGTCRSVPCIISIVGRLLLSQPAKLSQRRSFSAITNKSAGVKLKMKIVPKLRMKSGL